MTEKKKSFYANNVSEIPQTEHWAILRNQSVFIPGDERSRTHPGHGYPESTEHYMTYEVFTDKALFEGELQRAIKSDFEYHQNGKTIGIHVAGTFHGVPTIKVSETQ